MHCISILRCLCDQVRVVRSAALNDSLLYYVAVSPDISSDRCFSLKGLVVIFVALPCRGPSSCNFVLWCVAGKDAPDGCSWDRERLRGSTQGSHDAFDDMQLAIKHGHHGPGVRGQNAPSKASYFISKSRRSRESAAISLSMSD